MLKVSFPEVEGILTVSKWIKHQALLSANEMRDLLNFLTPCSLYNTAEVVTRLDVPIDFFLEEYQNYVQTLAEGKVPDEQKIRRLFSSAISKTEEALYAMKVGEGRYLIKPVLPVIQLQLHHFLASEADGKYHSMVFGSSSISWGLQFSYPQIYQDPKTKIFAKVVDADRFPNTAVFSSLSRWLRQHTVPTTFIWKGKKTATPMRLGKDCFSWIGNHLGLLKEGIEVYVY